MEQGISISQSLQARKSIKEEEKKKTMATSLTQAYLKHEIKSKLDIETGREAVPDDEPTDAGDGEKSKTPTRFITVAVITVALAMIVLNGLVMTVAGEGIVYVAAFVAIVVGIANIGTELILGKMDSK